MRVRNFFISPDLLATIWTGNFRVHNPIPPDAKLVRCCYDMPTDRIVLTMEHETFGDVPPGTEIPPGDYKVIIFERTD